MIQVLQENLLRAVKEVKHTGYNSTLPVINYALIGYSEGYLYIVTHDLEKHTIAKCGCRADNNTFTCCVPMVVKTTVTNWKNGSAPYKVFSTRTFYPLLDWLKVCGESLLSLDFDEKICTLTIRAGNSRTTFKCLPVSEFPPVLGLAFETT